MPDEVAARAVAKVLDVVPYLRVNIGATDRDDWLVSDRLLSDVDHLRQVVVGTAEARGTDRLDVAMSLFVQGYAFRVASIAIGAWLLDDIVLDVGPQLTSISLGRNRPDAVHLADCRAVPAPDPRRGLHEALVDGHLALLVEAAHQACRIGWPLLWSNVGAACASSFGAFMVPLPDRHRAIRSGIESFMASARPELAGAGRVAPVGPVWAWERSACCLFYKTASGTKCEDCSLVPPAERRARYERVVEALAG